MDIDDHYQSAVQQLRSAVDMGVPPEADIDHLAGLIAFDPVALRGLTILRMFYNAIDRAVVEKQAH